MYSHEEIQSQLAEHNVTLKEHYKNSHFKHRFSCLIHPNQEFVGTVTQILNRNVLYCPECRKGKYQQRRSKGFPLDYDYVKKEFEQRGYELISKEYINADQKLEYKCLKHPDKKLFIDWNHFKKGRRCPFCKNYKGTSYPERLVLNFLKCYFNINDNHFYLSNKEYDIYIPELNLLIEYNGLYWHKNKKENDTLKKDLAKQKGYDFLVIKEVKEKIQPQIISEEEINLYYNFQKGLTYSTLFLKILLEFINQRYNKDLDFENVDFDAIRFISLADSRVPISNSVEQEYPIIKNFWDYNKNKGLTPKSFTHGSSVKIWLKCPICGQEWETTIVDFCRRSGAKEGKIKCRFCKNIITLLTNF